MSERRDTVAVALGDPNGIGPEIAVRAALHFASDATLNVVLVGDEHVIRHYAAMIAPRLPVVPMHASASQGGDIRIAPVQALPPAAFAPGRECAAAGRAMVEYLRAATQLVKAGDARAIVGCPHSETAVNAAGIRFDGYPSLLARLIEVPKDRVFLMLVGGGLRIVHVTLHERLNTALARLTAPLVESAVEAAVQALSELGIDEPKIGVFGINPHAGEGGLFGDDDRDITECAAARLRARGFRIEGPIGADLLLTRSDIDVFVAMYHDQGHIPIKLLAGRASAAVSIGAGIMFSSVGHGCAFDIAGRGVADAAPLLRTIELVAGRPTPDLARRAA